MAVNKEERRREGEATTTMESESSELTSHKTKIINFLGRTTPIVLQNDNGPCPLLAICNVLLLKNNLNLTADVAEVSQEKLLSLVAERLIDSNSNVDDKEVGFVENQQQNIADAIDLLPRLATGIDVNIKFTRIDDFEFTRECAIFDLLDIPLYHGWIVDPQDCETANAIGLKSYNTLMGELVALETRNMDNEQKKNIEEDSVDFVAATTAALGVPSPSLSRGRSLDGSPKANSGDDTGKKGDVREEETELLRALKSSDDNQPILANDLPSLTANGHSKPDPVLKEQLDGFSEGENEKSDLLRALISSDDNQPILANDLPSLTSNEHSKTDPVKEQLDNFSEGENEKSDMLTPSMSLGFNAFSQSANEIITLELTPNEDVTLKTEQENDLGLSNHQECGENRDPSVAETSIGILVLNENAIYESSEQHPAPSCQKNSHKSTANVDCEGLFLKSIENLDVVKPPTFVFDIHKPEPTHECDAESSSSLVKTCDDSDSSSVRREDGDLSGDFSSCANVSEPIYEGEECILESGSSTYEDREPMYEGEVILTKQGDLIPVGSSKLDSKEQCCPKQGEFIRNFLKNSASQLTINGLFCLQDGLKERELCVFFRNNHFNTMFKFEGELYILATDQGYLNQTDLVWEKLNEVNGDTVFMTSNFKEFNVETQDSSFWNEHNAVASTTDYIASIDNANNSGSSFSSDLQLAIALQQQEFENQQPQRNVQQQPPPPATSNSRLVVGPQVPRQSGRNSAMSLRQESKSSKDRCNIM